MEEKPDEVPQSEPIRAIVGEKPADGRWLPWQRQAAIEAVAAEGSAEAAAQVVGIPPNTIRGWMRDPVGKATAVRASRELAGEARLAAGAVIRRAFELLMTRLETGDSYVVTEGERGSRVARVMYVPVKARDLAIIVGITLEKLSHLERWADGGAGVSPSKVAELNRENVDDLDALLREARRRLDARGVVELVREGEAGE